MKLRFLGTTRQVTDSRYLLDADELRLLVDCGLFQERARLARNWDPYPIPPNTVEYLLLTHAHLDHSGLIPKLVHEGFRHHIMTTEASKGLGEVILGDAGIPPSPVLSPSGGRCVLVVLLNNRALQVQKNLGHPPSAWHRG